MPRALRRAAALASLVAALAPAPAAAAPIALGAFIPGASEHPGLIDAYGRRTGRPPVVVSSYKDWSSLPFDRFELDAIWRRGAVPMVTWEPWTSAGRGIGLRAIATGRFDRYLRRAAGSATAWGRPLLVRFAQEMNGDWFPWGRGHGGTPRDYRKAWKHVVDLFRRRGATNVRWVWSPNEDSGGSFPFAEFYPGDRWVDWVGLDGFNFGGGEGWPSFTRVFASSYDRLVGITSRPLMVAETGAAEEGGDKAAWIASALEREAPGFAHLRALVWFDAEASGRDLRVNSSAASLRAFRRAIRSPAYAAGRRRLLSTPAALPGSASAPAEPAGGYGAPSFLERLRQKLHGAYLWAALSALALALFAAALLSGRALRRRGRRPGAGGRE